MSSTPAAFPANWYPAPNDPSRVRYWDGARWTEHFAARDPALTPDMLAPPAPDTELRTGGSPTAAEPAATSVTLSTPVERKVGLFGARSLVKDLTAENGQLRAALEKVGALTLAEIELKTQAAHEELAELTAMVGAASSLADLQQRVAAAGAELAELTAAAERDRARHARDHAQAAAELEALRRQVLDVRHAIDVQEFGLYNFEHPAESSADLADDLARLRAQIKTMVRDGKATEASNSFTFNGSASKGTQMVKGLSKTMLAAYNAEAENAIKTVKAGGLSTAAARLDKVVEQVERNGAMINLKIAWPYHRLRKKELELAALHAEAVKAEREAEREHRAQLREAKRVEDELRREREKLDKERDHYANALAALLARGDEAGATELQAKLADIEQSIADVDYRAANVRAGYVYVISNIGAFGETVVKIGMTRRLDPMDRVRELGDASVPFTFDVHALFFSEDAFGIEAMLHRHFADRRVNRINTRREFFYATPQEVLDVLRAHKVAVVEYRTEADAEEFRASREIAAAAA